MPDEYKISPRRVKYVAEEPTGGGDDGWNTPYANYLEDEIEAITEMLGQLILLHGEKKPIDSLLDRIEGWMGDDWNWILSDADQVRFNAIKGYD